MLQGHKSEKVFFSLIGIREGRLKKGGFRKELEEVRVRLDMKSRRGIARGFERGCDKLLVEIETGSKEI
jgi:hypothetical protein